MNHGASMVMALSTAAKDSRQSNDSKVAAKTAASK